MHRLLAVVWLCACSHDTHPAPPAPPDPLPVVPADAALADTCEPKLRAFATKLGDPTPTLGTPTPRNGGRSDRLDCPATVDDAACERLARAHVTLAAGETATVDVGAVPELAYYELVYTLDGTQRTEHVADPAAGTAHLRSLKAAGHTVVPLSEQRVTRPTAARVATISIVGPVDRIEHTAEIIAPVDPTLSGAERAAVIERMTTTATDLDIIRWSLRADNAVDLVVSCVTSVTK